MIQLNITQKELSLLELSLESHIDSLQIRSLDVQAYEYESLLKRITNHQATHSIEELVGYNFFSWAEEFFTEDLFRLNIYIPLNYLLQEYNMNVGIGAIATHSFEKKMIQYSIYKGWELNPKEIQTGQGRIIKSCNSLVFDRDERIWVRDNHKKAQSMFYIQTPGNQLTERIYDPTAISRGS